jgi:Protein of unknown function (DUF3822)
MQNFNIHKNNAKQLIKTFEAVHLAIQVQKKGLLLCVLKAANQEIAFTNWYDHADGGADGRSIMAMMKDCNRLNIKSTVVGLDEDRFMVLPNHYQNDAQIKAAFEYVHHIENNEILDIQKLNFQDFFGAYLIKNSTKHVFMDWQKNTIFANTAISLLGIYPQYLIANQDQIFIHFSENKMVMSVYKQSALQLHNSFDFFSVDDVFYQLQKQLQLHQLKNVQIQINGLLQQNLLEELQQYYASAAIQQLPNGFIYSSEIVHTKASFLIPILALAKYAHH